MGIHDPKHPLWGILQQLVSSSVIILSCALLYKSGLVPKDFWMVLFNAAGLLLVNWIKNLMIKEPTT